MGLTVSRVQALFFEGILKGVSGNLSMQGFLITIPEIAGIGWSEKIKLTSRIVIPRTTGFGCSEEAELTSRMALPMHRRAHQILEVITHELRFFLQQSKCSILADQ